MDLPIYLGLGLLAGGYALNSSGKQARPTPSLDAKKREDQLENKKAGNANIYNSGYFTTVRSIEDEKVITNFEKSFDPINTNIIPFYFNTLNETNLKHVKNPTFNKDEYQKEVAKVMKTTPPVLTKLDPVPNDLTIVNQDSSVESGGWQGTPPHGLYANTDLDKNFAEIVSRPETDRGLNNRETFDMPMTHNNMIPFFGSTAKQNMDIDNRRTADKLENFTGQFKLDKQHKTEVGSLFAPVQQNLEQLIAPRELDRFTTALQIRNNELPFEQIRVGHGLNDGYTARPSGGFHNPLRVLPKNIDQLLVNPRVVSEGRVIRGKDNVDKRTAQQQQYKYRPELLVTNFNGERNFTTTGERIKPTMRSAQVIRATNRIKAKQLTGTAGDTTGSKLRPSKRLPFIHMSSKRAFKNTPFRNSGLAEGGAGIIDGHLSVENKRNERSVTETRYGEKGYSFYNRKFDVGQGQTYPYDKAKKTRNQAYIFNKYPLGNIQVTAPKSKVYNKNDVAKSTIRQTTENQTHQGHIGQAQKKSRTYNPNDVTRTTIRQTTENQTHQGHIAQTQKKSRAYNPNDVTRTTIRQTTENQTHQGHIAQTQKKSRTYNPNDVTRTTIRQTTENQTHQGHMGQASQQKSRTYNPNDVTRTTIRQTTEKQTHQGHMGQTSQQKSRTYNPNDVTRTTIRQTTENQTHHGQVGQASQQKSRTYNPNDVTRTTIRQTTENQTHQGALQNNVGKSLVYDPVNYAPRTTIRETSETNTHQGALQNPVTKGIVYDGGFIPKTTLRELDENNTHQGQLNPQVNKSRAYDPQDLARVTIREGFENNTHTGQLQAESKGMAYDPYDVSRTTGRELSENNTHQGHLGQDSKKKSRAYDPEDVTRTTIRETTSDNTHQGQLQTQTTKSRVYNDNDRSRTTIRETTENQSDSQGQVQVGGTLKGKTYNQNDLTRTTHRETTERTDFVGAVSNPQDTRPYVYDPDNDIAKTTIREQTERTDLVGIVSHAEQTKQIAYDPDTWVGKTTIREQTENSDNYGIVSHPEQTKQIAYDPFDFAKTTIREQTEYTNYVGNSDADYAQNGLGYLSAPVDVKNTQRQFQTDYMYIKPATQADAPSNPQNLEFAYNMRQNVNNELVSQGRYPTLSNVKLFNGEQFTNMEIKKLDQDRLNQYSAMRAPTYPNSRKPMNKCELTSFKNALLPQDMYFDPSVLSTFNSNPLSQSLHSWS